MARRVYMASSDGGMYSGRAHMCSIVVGLDRIGLVPWHRESCRVDIPIPTNPSNGSDMAFQCMHHMVVSCNSMLLLSLVDAAPSRMHCSFRPSPPWAC